jgi:hypothetical protein
MPTYVRTQEIAHDIGASGSLSLRVTSSDVKIEKAPGTSARVRVEFSIRASSDAETDEIFDRVKFRVRSGDGRLEVAEPRRDENGLLSIVRLLGRSGAKADASVVAEVPGQASVSCAGVSAELIATGLIGDQEYRTVSGDLVLSEAAGSIRVSAVSGDVTLRGVGPVALRANTVSGDVSAFVPRFESARLVTVSGDIELEGKLADGGDHRIETVSGDLSLGSVGGMLLEVRGLSTDVDITLPHRAEGTRDRRQFVIGEGGPRIVFSSMSGDANVGRARRMGGDDRGSSVPVPPSPPAPPAAPAPLAEADQLEILRALEAGEIDVDEAARRLAGGRADA